MKKDKNGIVIKLGDTIEFVNGRCTIRRYVTKEEGELGIIQFARNDYYDDKFTKLSKVIRKHGAVIVPPETLKIEEDERKIVYNNTKQEHTIHCTPPIYRIMMDYLEKIESIVYKKDGDKICATFGNFINLQESVAGFGDTKEKAMKDLLSK